MREPAGYLHGAVAARLGKLLSNHVDDRGLGLVLAAETGFKLASDPDTVRAPDVAFIRKERLPNPPPSGYAELAPDLVVEVLSPDDRPGAVLAKVADWSRNPARLGRRPRAPLRSRLPRRRQRVTPHGGPSAGRRGRRSRLRLPPRLHPVGRFSPFSREVLQ